MRKEYVKPMMAGEEFVANEYIAACYQGVCDISGYVFTDADADGVYDEGSDPYKYENTACGNEYWVEGVGAVLPDKNAFVFKRREYVVTETIMGFPVDGYYKGVGTPTRVWNFDEHHVTTQMNPQSRTNHS